MTATTTTTNNNNNNDKLKEPLLSTGIDYGMPCTTGPSCIVDINELTKQKIMNVISSGQEVEGVNIVVEKAMLLDEIDINKYNYLLSSTYYLAFFYYLMLPWLFGAYIAIIEKFAFASSSSSTHDDTSTTNSNNNNGEVPGYVTYVIATLLFVIQYCTCRYKLNKVVEYITTATKSQDNVNYYYSDSAIDKFYNIVQLRWYGCSIFGLVLSYGVALSLIMIYGNSEYTLTITMSTPTVLCLCTLLTLLYIVILCQTIFTTSDTKENINNGNDSNEDKV